MIFEAVKEDIVFGHLHPRERLVEADLVARFSSHRPAVREALNELAVAGLVEHIPNRGISVLDMSAVQVKKIYAVRIELEVLAASWIPLPIARKDVVALEQIQKRHSEATDKRSLPEIFRFNDQFHDKLYSLCGNPYLLDLIDSVALRALTIRYSAYMERDFLIQVRDDHMQMIEAVSSNDTDKLVEIVRRHVERGMKWYQDQYDKRRPPVAQSVPL